MPHGGALAGHLHPLPPHVAHGYHAQVDALRSRLSPWRTHRLPLLQGAEPAAPVLEVQAPLPSTPTIPSSAVAQGAGAGEVAAGAGTGLAEGLGPPARLGGGAPAVAARPHPHPRREVARPALLPRVPAPVVAVTRELPPDRHRLAG
jgi:hypothetical protein